MRNFQEINISILINNLHILRRVILVTNLINLMLIYIQIVFNIESLILISMQVSDIYIRLIRQLILI